MQRTFHIPLDPKVFWPFAQPNIYIPVRVFNIHVDNCIFFASDNFHNYFGKFQKTESIGSPLKATKDSFSR